MTPWIAFRKCRQGGIQNVSANVCHWRHDADGSNCKLLWATSKWNNDVNRISSLRSMIRWKWMPGLLYQMIEMGERVRQRRDRKRERVWEAEHSWKWRIVSAIKLTIRGNICDRHVRLISESIKMLLMTLFPQFASFLLSYRWHSVQNVNGNVRTIGFFLSNWQKV